MLTRIIKAAIITVGIVIISSYFTKTSSHDTYYSSVKKTFSEVIMNIVGLLKSNSFETCLSSWGPTMLVLTKRQRQNRSKLEGHIWNHVNDKFLRSSQHCAYYRRIMEHRHTISRICEIGFNGGHSSLMWAILFNGSIQLLVFDMCSRNKVVRGDSRKTIPLYRHINPNEKCDFISIDGGHLGKVSKTDLLNMQYLAADQNTVVMDDVNIKSNKTYLKTVGKAWKYAVTNRIIIQTGECSPCTTDSKIACAFCFGKYLKKTISHD